MQALVYPILGILTGAALAVETRSLSSWLMSGLRHVGRKEYVYTCPLPPVAIQTRLTLSTDQLWYKAKDICTVTSMKGRGARFVGSVRACEFNVAFLRIVGSSLGGPWAHGKTAELRPGISRVKVAVTYYWALVPGLLAAIVLPFAFNQVFGFRGAVAVSSIVVPAEIVLGVCFIRFQVRHLLKELQDLLSLEAEG